MVVSTVDKSNVLNKANVLKIDYIIRYIVVEYHMI